MYKAVHTIKREVTTNQLGVEVGVSQRVFFFSLM